MAGVLKSAVKVIVGTIVIVGLLFFIVYVTLPRHGDTTETAPPSPRPFVTVVSPEAAASSPGGWVAWPSKEDMAEKAGHWAVFVYPIKANGYPVRTNDQVITFQSEIFAKHYPPIEGAGDGWVTIRQRWLINNQLCEARYYRRGWETTSLSRLMNELPSKAEVKPAPAEPPR